MLLSRLQLHTLIQVTMLVLATQFVSPERCQTVTFFLHDGPILSAEWSWRSLLFIYFFGTCFRCHRTDTTHSSIWNIGRVYKIANYTVAFLYSFSKLIDDPLLFGNIVSPALIGLYQVHRFQTTILMQHCPMQHYAECPNFISHFIF